MRVHGVVVPDGLAGLGAQHLAGEDTQLRRQLGLGEALERTGMDVADQDAVGGRDDGRQRGTGGPGEDVDLDALLGQSLRELEHVDIHATGIADAWLVEW